MKTLICCLFLLSTTFALSQQKNVQKLNDEAISIYRTNPKKALSFLTQAKNLSEIQLDNDLTNNNFGIVYRFLGEFEKAKQFSLKALESEDLKIQASASNNMGACARSLGQYEEAIKFYIKALRNYEKLKEDREYAIVSNNIGVVYNSLELYEKAKEYHRLAMTKFDKANYKKGLSEAYNNYAMVLVNQDSLENALNYFVRSLNIERELGDKKGISESLNNVGGIYYYKGDLNKSLQYFKEVLQIEKSIKNLGGIASTYNNIAQVLIDNKDYSTAKKYIDTAYSYSKENKISEDYLTSIQNYITYNEQLQKYKDANRYYKTYTSASDSIRQKTNLQQLHETETKYQTEKKEKEILIQKAELAESRLKIERKNLWIIIVISLAALTGLIGYLFYRTQKLKNNQLKKENELKDALIKIETQNKIQEERLRISRDLHDNIGSQLTFIISSLDNLKFQLNKENPEAGKRLEDINQFTRTTITELRDTIWAMNKESISSSDLQIRINNFIENAKMASPRISFQVNVKDELNDIREFTAFEGINIYRVIQEFINNSIKHSEATEVRISFDKENGRFLIRISDNGKGFDEANLKQGNGLNNMHKRIAEIGGELSIQSQPGQGTVLKLNI